MMKYLLLIAVVFAVIWYMRGGRDAARNAAGGRRSASPPPQDMVECPVCHVHLPRADALPGPAGQLYCCAEHVRRGA
jgi:uncharacterized protein